MLSRLTITRALPPDWRIEVEPLGGRYLVTLVDPDGLVRQRATAGSSCAINARVKRFGKWVYISAHS